ncbi:unnamed protein product (macronuclear) [Paramecium tetraurelia]|uniref:Uncharacterized protein n=1 Tax=Paramecium tetraurelia TaxID=5888 RepID=A0CIC8_PARTE|nr:uncharacterized protein GSPATT00007680001 [Paramecium tetraurelia]CAK70545.1 unnamed protein product [Paramecium tetraurelia]|eukprot:XP_001437942.1 hypothetical protein (macronuclear) [Paramecium tetraurelia strain d4-2]
MQTEVAPCSQDQNQKDTLMKMDNQINEEDNQNQNEAMDIENNHFNQQNQSKNCKYPFIGKRKQIIVQTQPSLILNEKRQRKPPSTAYAYRDPSPQKIVEKKKPQKYQISSRMDEICTNIAKWEQFQKGLNNLGYPSIVLDEEKIYDLLKDYDQKDEAGKEYLLKMLLRIVGEAMCFNNKNEINTQIKNKIESITQSKNIIINWTLQKWEEQIKSFLEIKAELSEEIQFAQHFDFQALQTIIGNNLPNYIEEAKFNVTLIALKSKQIDDLKKVCDLNELKNVRLIREYLITLNHRVDSLKKIKEKINAIKKYEDENEIIESYNQLDSKILEFKNTPIKFLQKTEVKVKPPTTQPKQKSKPQNLEKIENNLSNENEQINSQGNVQTESNQPTEQKINENKSNKKKEKEQQKQEKVAKGALDKYKFKKLEIQEIQNQNPKLETQNNQFESVTSPRDNNQQTSGKDVQLQDTNETQQNRQTSQQPQQQQQPQPQITGKNLKHFFFEKKQQVVQKQDEYQRKQLTPNRMEQFEALIEKMSNMQLQEEKVQVSLNDYNSDEIEIQETKPQQVRIRKIHIYIADSDKEFNGHQFVQLSQVIRPRAPFQLDDEIDYDKDSLDEVEEILAENLSDINDSDEDQSEESEQKDSFLVDDNHLSQDEVEDPEEMLNNKCIANNTQVQNGIVYIKFSQIEPVFFENYKAQYIPQYFANQQLKEQTHGNTLQSILTQQGNNTKITQIPKAKMNFSNNNQKKQNKPKKPKATPNPTTDSQNQTTSLQTQKLQSSSKTQVEKSATKQKSQTKVDNKVDEEKIQQKVEDNNKCEQEKRVDQQKEQDNEQNQKLQQNFIDENLQ